MYFSNRDLKWDIDSYVFLLQLFYIDAQENTKGKILYSKEFEIIYHPSLILNLSDSI